MVSTKKTKPKTSPTSNKRIVITLLFIMTILLLARAFTTSVDKAGGDSEWLVTINISFNAKKDESLLIIGRPYETINNELVQQTIKHPGLKIRSKKLKDDSIRGIDGLATKDGKINTSVEYFIHQSISPRIFTQKPGLSTTLREKYLMDEPLLDITNPAIIDITNKVNETIDDKQTFANKIYAYTRNLKPLKHKDTRPLHKVIKSKNATVLERALLFVSLARSEQIPSRLVSGLILHEANYVTPHYWVQIYQDDKWIPFDPFYGYESSLPNKYVPFRYNNANIVELTNGDELNVNYQIKRAYEIQNNSKYSAPHWYNILDLSRLNIDIRDSLAVLLLLPISVFITAIFRHFIGVHSYGVFTPTLLALAVTRNDWLTTLITISTIVIFYATARKLFPGNLSRTPRLSIIFTIVALSMAFSISLLDYYLPNPDGYAVLLPIVILTFLIDKFYLTIDERGLHVAYIRLLWTFVITACSLPLVQYIALGHFLVTYPELHLLTLSCILMITHYRGNKVSEYLPETIRKNAGV